MSNSHEYINSDELLSTVNRQPTDKGLSQLREFHAEKRLGIKAEAVSASLTYLRVFTKEAQRNEITLSPEFRAQIQSLDSIPTAEERSIVIEKLWEVALNGFSNMSKLVGHQVVEFSPKDKALIQADAIKSSGLGRSLPSSIISPPDIKNPW